MTKNLLSLLITVTLLTGMLYGMESGDTGSGHCAMELEGVQAATGAHLSSLPQEIMDKIGNYLTWRDILNLRQVSKSMCARLSDIYKPISLEGNTESLIKRLEMIQSQDWLKGNI